MMTFPLDRLLLRPPSNRLAAEKPSLTRSKRKQETGDGAPEIVVTGEDPKRAGDLLYGLAAGTGPGGSEAPVPRGPPR